MCETRREREIAREVLTRAASLGALSPSAFAPSETFLQVYPRKGNPSLRGESRQQPPPQVVREGEELAVVPRQGVTTDRRGKVATFWRGGQQVTGQLTRVSGQYRERLHRSRGMSTTYKASHHADRDLEDLNARVYVERDVFDHFSDGLLEPGLVVEHRKGVERVDDGQQVIAHDVVDADIIGVLSVVTLCCTRERKQLVGGESDACDGEEQSQSPRSRRRRDRTDACTSCRRDSMFRAPDFSVLPCSVSYRTLRRRGRRGRRRRATQEGSEERDELGGHACYVLLPFRVCVRGGPPSLSRRVERSASAEREERAR